MIGDLLGALIGVVAIALTTYTIIQTGRQRRVDAFTNMHSLLITPESQRGRGMVYAAATSGSWPDRDSPEWDEMNRAFSLLETLAKYIDWKIVDRDLAMESWHQAFRRMRGPAEHFMNLRGDDYVVWPYLMKVSRDAETYQYRNPPRPPAKTA